MFLVLCIQNGRFTLQESGIDTTPKTATSFFDFQKKEDFSLENLARITKITTNDILDLGLRGLITPEAQKIIREKMAIQ
ncbi:MAG TPA: hypothetical protein PLQ44_02320 [Candidatus Paceibacterota bacterium]|nr:hypothetical protein [Candidatus Paceibacterota bacterium]HPT40414.1 hypothetical protein [Candidatus Paceibacterota bacterium]